MGRKSELLTIAKPTKTWQLVKGFIDGLERLEDVRFGELVTVPTIAGSYVNIGNDNSKKLGNTPTWYIGYAPVFEQAGTAPIAFDVCFHTSQGVVPMLRIGGLDSLDADLVDEINDLKLKANSAICQRLEDCGCNDLLARYQWYACLLEHMGIPIKPGEAKEKTASVIDVASDEEGLCVKGKYGINADDSAAAIKVLHHLGFIFKAPRKMPATYPKDLNAYVATLLKDGNHYQVIVSHDIEPYMIGNKAEIMSDHNGAVSHFRPMFAANARAAGQLFSKQLGLPGQTTILTDEDPIDSNVDLDDIMDLPEEEPERLQPQMTGKRRVPVSVPEPSEPLNASNPEEREAREFLREQGYRLVPEGNSFVLLREVARVRDVFEAADVVEEDSLYELDGEDFYEEEAAQPWRPSPPSSPPMPRPRRGVPTPQNNRGSARRVLHSRNTPSTPPPPRPRASRVPVPEEEIDDVIEIGRDRGGRNFTARFGGEVIAEHPSLEELTEQVRELVSRHPDFRNSKIMYRKPDGSLVPTKQVQNRRMPE